MDWATTERGFQKSPVLLLKALVDWMMLIGIVLGNFFFLKLTVCWWYPQNNLSWLVFNHWTQTTEVSSLDRLTHETSCDSHHNRYQYIKLRHVFSISGCHWKYVSSLKDIQCLCSRGWLCRGVSESSLGSSSSPEAGKKHRYKENFCPPSGLHSSGHPYLYLVFLTRLHE